MAATGQAALASQRAPPTARPLEERAAKPPCCDDNLSKSRLWEHSARRLSGASPARARRRIGLFGLLAIRHRLGRAMVSIQQGSPPRVSQAEASVDGDLLRRKVARR